MPDLDGEGRCILCGELPAAICHEPAPPSASRVPVILLAVAIVLALAGVTLSLYAVRTEQGNRQDAIDREAAARQEAAAQVAAQAKTLAAQVAAQVQAEIDRRSQAGAARFCALVGALPSDPLVDAVRAAYCPGGHPAPTTPGPAPAPGGTTVVVTPGPVQSVVVVPASPATTPAEPSVPPPTTVPAPSPRPTAPPAAPSPPPCAVHDPLTHGCLVP